MLPMKLRMNQTMYATFNCMDLMYVSDMYKFLNHEPARPGKVLSWHSCQWMQNFNQVFLQQVEDPAEFGDTYSSRGGRIGGPCAVSIYI